MNTINLRKCKLGDLLISRHGMILTYQGKSGSAFYPHDVQYPTGEKGTRCDDGFVFAKNRLHSDHDIVAVIRKGKIIQQTVLS